MPLLFTTAEIIIVLATALAVLALLFGFVVYFVTSYRQKQKDYRQLHSQKVEIDRQKALLETSLQDLQAAQKQLIHSEKMASLGELMAGIAHEIQNPLNFVNNFSEISVELLQEMNETVGEKLTGDDKVEADKLSEALAHNLKKIVTHGKRADSIVKNMLQHSQAGSSKKEPTDINALADEYLRLSYHGIRAKNKDFQAQFEAHLDEQVGKVEVVPQEIGRVLLNLFNNAFYSVAEKRKKAGNDYHPLVTVTTKRIDSGIEIIVRDNGLGIEQKIGDKIFQPFFTTKPAGQGTGLGLSLSYDIIKAHGGEMKLETAEGEYAAFIIRLPAVQ